MTHHRTIRFMGALAHGHHTVRDDLDGAVAEAADRWVSRAADATAYADLVEAVLARREALSPMSSLPPYGTPSYGAKTPSYSAESPAHRVEPEAVRRRHVERRVRPRWPHAAVAVEARPGPQLPTRPPGRHRQPPRHDLAPRAIDLDQNLTTVLDWLGRPES
jgi:hypothetical protein